MGVVWVSGYQHQHISPTLAFTCGEVFMELSRNAEICRYFRMAAQSAYPPILSPDQLRFLLSEIKNWSILNGLAVHPSTTFVSGDIDPTRALVTTAPVTLFPSLFPHACFEEARAIQIAYNELYAAIANDKEWLSKIVQE